MQKSRVRILVNGSEIRAVAGKLLDGAVYVSEYGMCRQLFVSFDTFSGS